MISMLKKHFELLVWLTSLVLLFFMNVEQEHFSLCPLSAIGFSWCPGCGIGHSIHFVLHLDFAAAWQEHYLGIPATGIILYRISQLFNFKFQTKSTTNGTADL